MNHASRTESARQTLLAAQEAGPLAVARAYLRLSGPGWLQSALTLGGGSLGSSLYLGVLGGLSLLWLQPFAMLLGVVMMSAISYATLSTGKRPFRAINEHINPVLGWSWLAAALMANMVWSMPQYSLCFAVCEQNFFPSVFAEGGLLATSAGDNEVGKWVVSAVVLTLCTLVTWSYGSGSLGVRLYDLVLKIAVAVIVVAFFAVVAKMAATGGGLDFGAILAGLIPDPRQLYAPSDTLLPLLSEISDPEARRYWSDLIVSEQRDVMISAGAAAVGINATFLLPYTLLNHGWGKEFRGFAIFDLSTGAFIPFVLATGCIVIASAVQFHGRLPEGFVVADATFSAPAGAEEAYTQMLDDRRQASAAGRYEMPEAPGFAEQKIAAVLVRRDTGDLARSLEKLFQSEDGAGGRFLSNAVFGCGVIAMTLSSISLMMLISGLVVCEILDRPASGWTFRLGCLISGVGVAWPLLWQDEARAWLTIVAGVYGAMLLPIAYTTFAVMMNQRSLLGDEMPRGASRVVWNLAMAVAVVAAAGAGVSAVWKKAGATGLAFVGLYILLVIGVQLYRQSNQRGSGARDSLSGP